MRILIAADGSLGTDSACDWLARFRWTGEDQAVVMSVVPEIQSLTGRIDRSVVESHGHAVAAETYAAEQLVGTCASKLAAYFETVETRIHAGQPADEILGAASEIGADLIVVGRHGRSLFKGWILGSVSQAVLQNAPCSVLVARPICDLVSRIVLAYDGSPESDAALRWTVALAHSGGCAEVEVVSVVEPVPMAAAAPAFYSPVDYFATAAGLDEESRNYASEHARTAAMRLKAEGVDASATVRFGGAGSAILDLAANERAALIILGAHAQHALPDFLIGNSALQVVKGASCSVLVARSSPPEEHERPSRDHEGTNEDVLIEADAQGHEGTDELMNPVLVKRS